MTYGRFLYKHAYLLVLAAWLITISFFVDNYWSANASLNSVRKAVVGNLHQREKAVDRLLSDSSLLDEIESGHYGAGKLTRLTEEPFFVFFYHPDPISGEKLSCWNTQQVLPYPSLLYDSRRMGFIHLQNGYYVWGRHQYRSMKMITLIPVKWDYVIQNEYLKNDFVSRQSISMHYDLGTDTTKGVPVFSKNGTRLFQLYETAAQAISQNNPVAIGMQLLSMLLILLLIHLHAVYIAERNSVWKAGLFLLITLTGIRLLTYLYPIPMNYRQFELFDPAVYGSNPVFRSLGDMFINVLFFAWLVLFIRYYTETSEHRKTERAGWKGWAWLMAGSLFLLAVTWLAASLIRSLVADSQISFDVMNFFTLNIYSVVGFVTLCCISIGYFFICQLVLYLIDPWFRNKPLPLLLSVAILGLLFLSFRIGHIRGGFELYVLIWLIGFLALLNSHWFNLIASRIVSSNLVFWLFIFSVSITGILISENDSKEIRKRMHYAEILSQKSDPAKETLINTMLTAFNTDFLSNQFLRLQQPGENMYLKDSLINSNTAGYNNRFDTRVYSFSADEKPLFNADSTGYDQINTILNTQSKPTNTPGLYYFDESYDLFSYICKRTLRAPDSTLLGYVFILSSPRKVKKDALYPELFSRGSQYAIEQSSLYAFAQYNNWKLVSVHNDYPFPSALKAYTLASQQYRIVQKDHYSELWYHAGGGRVIAIVKERSRSIESITLFSYLFCSFLIVAAVFWFISTLVRSRFSLAKFKTYWQLNIRNQIHGTIIFISALSFIIIGFATILFFVNRYEANNREKLSRTIHIMENELRNTFNAGWNMRDSLSHSDFVFGQGPEQVINKISEIHGVDVNLYDLEGNLRVSSLPMLYTKGVVSSKIDPVAYYHLHMLREVQFYQQEQIGRLPFASNYVPVKDERGNDYAYLNIPYFTSQSNLRQEISNFLVTIINLNAFIFLIAGIIALFITNRITASFSLISEKMKKVKIGSRNEAIVWKRQDELGELVGEYNKMVSQLEDSARAMAKSEREGAWREMARQVAHEIKNPLTPMKLSIQYLQKAIESNAPNVKELTAQVANTLVEQIEHLSQIAGDFSQFAHIGESAREEVNLNDVLDKVLDLYASNEKLVISKQLLEEPVRVIGDRTHMNRLFNNLVLNAIQAVPDDRVARIDIRETLSDGKVLISISDNGQGINQELQSRIFAPNFTTKTSGTGLGLAMCKRIVEQAEGEIWFDTTPGTGTSFFVMFPLMSS